MILYFIFISKQKNKVALGVFGKGCYLSESWNKLDCFIVLTGWVAKERLEGLTTISQTS